MPRCERGFTLLETTIALALLCAIALAGAAGLMHGGGDTVAVRTQVAAFFAMAKSRAEANADGSANTGATVVASYAPPPDDTTTLALYDGRPFGGAPIRRTPNLGELRVGGRVSLDANGSASPSDRFAVFVGTSGSTSAQDGYVVNGTALAAEPPCDLRTGLTLDLARGASSSSMALSCATGEIVP